jgi:hypothetical protein
MYGDILSFVGTVVIYGAVQIFYLYLLDYLAGLYNDYRS